MKKKACLLAAILAIAAGTGLHFLYDLLPIPIVGVIAPVDESVWEHLKLLFWPTLVAACVLTRMAENRQRVWSGFLAAMLWMPAVLLAVYYVASAGFGIESTAFDIGLYIVVMALGFRRACRWAENGRAEKWTGLLVMLVGLYAACLVVLSFAAPELPIFTDYSG